VLTTARATRLAKLPRRETQQSKVYAAEGILWGTAVGTTRAEVQAYVDKVANYEWFRRRYGRQTFHVSTQRGLGGHGGHGDVAVGLNSTGSRGYQAGAQRNVVLHEMAHTIAGEDGGNWHGPKFARVMLELVSHAVSADAGKMLREQYKTHKVKLAPPTPLRASVPPAREVVQPKLWRVEYKFRGEQKTHSVEANSMAGALYSFQNTHNNVLREATNLRIWKGVRQAAATKPAARKRPARKG